MASHSEYLEVVALILVEGDKVLIAQRNGADKLAWKWEFPGGKIEEGESPEEALVREIREELGLEIAVIGHFLTSDYPLPSRTLRLHAYEGKRLQGTPQNLIHHQVIWVPMERLPEYDFAPADVPFVKKLTERDYSR